MVDAPGVNNTHYIVSHKDKKQMKKLSNRLTKL